MHSLNNSMFGFLFLLLSFFGFRGHAADQTYLYHVCPNTTTFAKNSAYENNIRDLLSSFSNPGSTIGFSAGYNKDMKGRYPDDVYGLFLCRGDLSSSVCQDCVKSAASNVTKRCPIEKLVVIWYDQCLLRYSNRSVFPRIPEIDVTPGVQMLNTQTSASPERFDNEVGILMNQTTVDALDSPRKVATRMNTITGFQNQTLYGLVQCTPDLSRIDCNRCLRGAIAILPNCCSGKLGGRVLYPSCNVRYEVYPFFNQSLTPPPPPAIPTGTTRGSPSKFPVAIILSLIIFVSLVIFAFFLLWKKKQKRKMKDLQKIKDLDGIDATELQFEFRTIRDATNNFSVENKLGRGGFGTVYKGRLSDGQNIAVKRLSSNSGQGEHEFKNEVLLVAKLQHKNLARLLGFCLEGSERLLIYEFMPNSSLDTFIFVLIKRSTLSWEIRYKIIRGIARGLLYLHEDSRLRVVHRDLKASNILLDANMDAKISDFGMARLFDMDQTQGDTRRIVGTFGYMAPEYLRRGHYSSKSDVFSFGVLILEIISGQKTSNFRNGGEEADLLAYAWENWREGTSLNLVDFTLLGSRSEMMQCIHIGLLCVQESIASRPTMASVVHMLTSATTSLPMPSKPAFLVAIRSDLSAAKKQSGIHSVNEVSITALDPR